MIVESYWKCRFSFKRNCTTISQNVFSILHSYIQCMQDRISLHAHQHLVLSLFFHPSNKCLMIHPCGFHFHFLILNDVENIFMYLPMHVLSVVKYLFTSFAHYMIRLIFFNCWIFRVIFIVCVQYFTWMCFLQMFYPSI